MTKMHQLFYLSIFILASPTYAQAGWFSDSPSEIITKAVVSFFNSSCNESVDNILQATKYSKENGYSVVLESTASADEREFIAKKVGEEYTIFIVAGAIQRLHPAGASFERKCHVSVAFHDKNIKKADIAEVTSSLGKNIPIYFTTGTTFKSNGYSCDPLVNYRSGEVLGEQCKFYEEYNRDKAVTYIVSHPEGVKETIFDGTVKLLMSSRTIGHITKEVDVSSTPTITIERAAYF